MSTKATEENETSLLPECHTYGNPKDPSRFQTNIHNSENNPCLKESKASMRCLMDTNGDKTKCQRFFDNYNECKTFWYEVTKSRRIAGISPSLPLLNDRQAFLKQYVQTGKIPITIENENST